MGTARFLAYELRTTDVDGARSFYTDVVGEPFWSAAVTVAPLPAVAAARGAPAHWLGHIGVGDVDAEANRLIALGAQPPGPPRGAESARALLRDPFGAIVALTSASAAALAPPPSAVAWHQHASHDLERAWRVYGAHFGWTREAATASAPAAVHGVRELVFWSEPGGTSGSITNTTGASHIHPQWLYYFRVPRLDASFAKVRARGGVPAMEPLRLGNGDRIAVCEDAQGAAFGLLEPAVGMADEASSAR